MYRLPCLLLAVLCLASPAFAQEKDAEGSKDHPAVPRMQNFYIANYENVDFGSYDFPLPNDQSKKVEGHYWLIEYYLKEGTRKPSALETRRNYQNAVAKAGGKVLLEIGDNHAGQLTAQLKPGGKDLWLHLDIANEGEVYSLHIVEEGGMNQQIELSASELAKALTATGSVALHNILFDTGKSTLKPESAAAIAPIGELLKNDATLKLEIQGHTDNVGAKDANLKLSRDRAEAVKAHLVSTFGIAAARLTTAGLGAPQPVAPNTTDEGRAQNRRVVLVKK